MPCQTKKIPRITRARSHVFQTLARQRTSERNTSFEHTMSLYQENSRETTDQTLTKVSSVLLGTGSRQGIESIFKVEEAYRLKSTVEVQSARVRG